MGRLRRQVRLVGGLVVALATLLSASTSFAQEEVPTTAIPDKWLPASVTDYKNGSFTIDVVTRPEDTIPCGQQQRVAYMFLVQPGGKMEAKELWDQWKADADRWARKFDECKNGVPAEFFVHCPDYNETTDAAKVKGFPDFFKFVNPTKDVCEWGNLLPCQAQLLSETYRHASPHTHHFQLASGDSFPQQTFAAYYKDVVESQMSRFGIAVATFSDYQFPGLGVTVCPKHQQWLRLKREHVKILVDAEHLWNSIKTWGDRKYGHGAGGGVAAPDEYVPSCLIKSIVGDKKWESDIETKFVASVCWEDCQNYGVCRDDRSPCRWSHLKASYLVDSANENKPSFIFRKIFSDTKVYQDSDPQKHNQILTKSIRYTTLTK